MKIVVTNDDGFESEGIAALVNRLSCDHDVCVVAPHRNRSGVSHHITMEKPLLIERQTIVNGSKRNGDWYSLEGFPADCVITALRGDFLPFFPDVVVSGINSDANLGTDVIYSGTCAAARQASLYGVPGIALSLCHKVNHGEGEECHYEALADFAARNIVFLAGLCSDRQGMNAGVPPMDREPLPYFVNVNALSAEWYEGMVLAGLSNREYRDSVEIEKTDDGKQYSIFHGGSIRSHGDGSDDYSIVQKGYVAISVLHTEAVCCEGINQQFVC
jgi:5'-nucleotidase